MVGYITPSTGGDYTPTPEGQHIAVCSRIVDLGTQPGSAMYPTPKPKIRVFWELPQERISYTNQDGVEKEGPVLHSEQFTVSFHEKATLRKTLEAWRGKPFSDEDFTGPPNGFHMKKLLGIPAVLQIVHEHRDGKTYANLNSIMKPMQDHFATWKGKIEGERIFFDLADFQQSEWDKLSERVQETIKRSPEYQKLFGQAPQPMSENPAHGMPALEDEIPF